MYENRPRSFAPIYLGGNCLDMLRKIEDATLCLVTVPVFDVAYAICMDTPLIRECALGWYSVPEGKTPNEIWWIFVRMLRQYDIRVGEALLGTGVPGAFNRERILRILRQFQPPERLLLFIHGAQAMPAEQLTLLADWAAERTTGERLVLFLLMPQIPQCLADGVASGKYPVARREDVQLSAQDVCNWCDELGIPTDAGMAKRILDDVHGDCMGVYLHLRERMVSGPGAPLLSVFSCIDHLFWKHLTQQQQQLMLWLAPLESVQEGQLCDFIGRRALDAGELKMLEDFPLIAMPPCSNEIFPHAVFREFLQEKLTRSTPGTMARFRMHLGKWYLAQGQRLKAAECLLQASAWDSLLSLQLTNTASIFLQGVPFVDSAPTFTAAADDNMLCRYAVSFFRIAMGYYHAGRVERFEQLMARMYRAISHLPDPRERNRLMGEYWAISALADMPDVEKMHEKYRRAAALSGGTVQSITPGEPYLLGGLSPVGMFSNAKKTFEQTGREIEEMLKCYSPMCAGHGSGLDVLYWAEISYHTGDIAQAGILAYKAAYFSESAGQDSVRMGVFELLAHIAVHRADVDGWRRAMEGLQQAAFSNLRNAPYNRILLDIVQGELLNAVGRHDDIADWLKEGTFRDLYVSEFTMRNAVFVHLSYLFHSGQYVRMLGYVETLRAASHAFAPFQWMYVRLFEAAACVALKKTEAAHTIAEACVKNLLESAF